jgi:hypothetical protein
LLYCRNANREEKNFRRCMMNLVSVTFANVEMMLECMVSLFVVSCEPYSCVMMLFVCRYIIGRIIRIIIFTDIYHVLLRGALEA